MYENDRRKTVWASRQCLSTSKTIHSMVRVWTYNSIHEFNAGANILHALVAHIISQTRLGKNKRFTYSSYEYEFDTDYLHTAFKTRQASI